MAEQAFEHIGAFHTVIDTELVLQLVRRLCSVECKLDELRDRINGRFKSHFTPEEFAAIVGRSAYTIRRWIAEKRLRATRVKGTGPKGRLLIPRAELDRLITEGKGGQIPNALVGDEKQTPRSF
jgi:excisionase family DNA binding protein